MKTLQKTFDSKLKEATSLKFLLRKVLNIKLDKSDAEIDVLTDNLLKSIEKNGANDTSIEIDDGTDEKIEITAEDINKVAEEMKDNIAKATQKTVEDAGKFLLEIIDEGAAVHLKSHREYRSGFEERLAKTWNKAFDAFEIFLLSVIEFGDEFKEEYSSEAIKKNDLVFDTLVRLHVRACQIANEVFTLIRTGYADGAHSRWRTLHEVTIVAMFINKHGNSIAERYRLHELIESYKAADQYQEHCGLLGYKPYSQKRLNQIKKHYDELRKKYGEDFKTDYGWANSVLKKKRALFSDIEKDVGLEHFRPYYRMASHNTHANPKGVTFKLGQFRDFAVLSAGATNTGFTDPAHQTAISLLQITSIFLLTRPNIDVFARFNVLKELERRIGKEFLKVQKHIEKKRINVE